MADKPNIINLSANLSGHGSVGTFNARATLSARIDGTGRTVNADQIFGQIDSWARMPEPRCSEYVQRVQDALQVCPAVNLDNIVGYRGRRFSGTTPSRYDFGPPPRNVAPPNRYNSPESPALYLCTTREAVSRELSASADVWVQQFDIPLAGIHVADLRSPEGREDQLLAAMMWFAELAGQDGYPNQDFSRLVASLVAEKFDGMLVSGVRGDQSLIYCNLVIFEPGDIWHNWLSSNLPSRYER